MIPLSPEDIKSLMADGLSWEEIKAAELLELAQENELKFISALKAPTVEDALNLAILNYVEQRNCKPDYIYMRPETYKGLVKDISSGHFQFSPDSSTATYDGIKLISTSVSLDEMFYCYSYVKTTPIKIPSPVDKSTGEIDFKILSALNEANSYVWEIEEENELKCKIESALQD